MSKSKKISSLFLSIFLAIVTCGVTSLFMMSSTSKFNKPSTPTNIVSAADNDTYTEIGSWEGLVQFAEDVHQGRRLDENIMLTADIKANNLHWTPIGSTLHPYTGKFDGGGHKLSGFISTVQASEDGNTGIFGYTNGATIYNLVLDGFSFSSDSPSATGHAGRLIGHANNTTLIDIYDKSTDTNLKTIGNSVGTKVYAGKTYFLNGSMQTQTKTDTESISFATGSAPISGYSLYVEFSSTKEEYISKSGAAASSASKRMAIDKTTGEVLAGLNSKTYLSALPKEGGDAYPYIYPKTTGNKLNGWKVDSSAATLNLATLATNAASASKRILTTEWTPNFNYTFNINNGDGTTSTIQVPANSMWEVVIGKVTENDTTPPAGSIRALKKGFELSSLISKTNPIVDKSLYSATVKYGAATEGANKEVTQTWSNYKRVAQWTDKSVNLNATWVGEPINTKIAFNTNDDPTTNATIKNQILASVSGLTVTYLNKPTGVEIPEPNVATTGTSGQYTFAAIATSKLQLTFTVKDGYQVGSVTMSGSGKIESSTTSGNTHTVVFSGITANTATLNISLTRKTSTVELTGTNIASFSLNGHDAQSTTLSSNVITTRLGENFTIVVVPKDGYAFRSFTTTPASPAHMTFNKQANDGDNGRVTVDVKGYSSSKVTFNAVAIAKNFTISLTRDPESNPLYTCPNAPELPVPTVTSGSIIHTGVSTTSGKPISWSDFVPAASGNTTITITVPTGAYYNAELTAKLGEVNIAGISKKIEGSNTVFTISQVIPGNSTVALSLTITKQDHNLTFGGVKIKSGDTFTTATNVGSVTFGGQAMTTGKALSKPACENVELKLNILDTVKDYYKFEGWYVKNGDKIQLITGATVNPYTYTTTAADAEIFAVVSAREISIGVVNSNIIENFDGTGKYSIKEGSALASTSDATAEFVYSRPSGTVNVTITAAAGYNFANKYIFYNPNINPIKADGTINTEAGVVILTATKNPFTGYGDFGSGAEAHFFAHPDWKLMPIVSQKTISVTLSAGTGTGAQKTATYYYGGNGLNLTSVANSFTKPGYTANGWSFTLGANERNTSENIILFHTIDNAATIALINSGDPSITLTRTYVANKNTLILNPNGGAFNGALDGWTRNDNGTISKAFYTDQALGELPKPTRAGYEFKGWMNGDVDFTASTMPTANTTLTAKWQLISFKIALDANGGSIATTSKSIIFKEKVGDLGVPTRSGFTFAGWIYINNSDIKTITSDSVFDATTFPTGNFAESNKDKVAVTLYAKWTFSDAWMVNLTGESKVYNGVKVDIKHSLNVPSGASIDNVNINSTTWTGEAANIASNLTPTVINVADSGDYGITYNITDKVSRADLAETKNISTTITINITPADLPVSVNISNDYMLMVAKDMAKQAGGVLKIINSDGFINKIANVAKFADLTASGNFASADYALVKAFGAYAVANPAIIDALKTNLDKLTWANVKQNLATENSFSAWADKTAVAAAVKEALKKVQPYNNTNNVDKTGLVFSIAGVGQTTFNNVIANGTLASKNVGEQAINVSLAFGGNNIIVGGVSNFKNVVADGANFKTETDITNLEALTSRYVYAPITSFNLSPISGIYSGKVHTFKLSATYPITGDEIEKVEILVSTATAGSETETQTFHYLDKTLKIDEIKVKLSGSETFVTLSSQSAEVQAKVKALIMGAGNNDGTYTIFGNADFKEVNFGTAVLSATSNGAHVKAATQSNNNIKLSKVILTDNRGVAITNDGDYYDGNKFILNITGNNTASVVLKVTDSVKSAVVETTGQGKFIGFLPFVVDGENAAYDDYIKTGSIKSGAQTVDLSLSDAFSGFFTNAAWVSLQDKIEDKTTAAGFQTPTSRFLDYTDKTSFTVAPTPVGYNVSWTGANVVGDKIDISGVNSLNITVTASYSIADFSIAMNDVSASTADNIDFAELAKRVTITPKANDLTYSYKWERKVGETWQTVTTLANNTTSNGTYRVTVTASKTGYTSVVSQADEFNITFTRQKITINSVLPTELTYNAVDLKNQIEIKYTVNSQQKSFLLSAGDALLSATITNNGQTVYEIRNTGEYNISLALKGDNTVYEIADNQTLNYKVTVTQAVVALDETKFAVSKVYLEADTLAKVAGKYTIIKAAEGEAYDYIATVPYGVDGANVKIGFSRAAGEGIGDYNISNIVSIDGNYKTNVTNGNNWFHITRRDAMKVTASISGSISHTYDKTKPSGISVNKVANTFEISLTGNNWNGKIVLSNFKESGAGLNERAISVDNVAIDESFFNISEILAEAGDYKIELASDKTIAYNGAYLELGDLNVKVNKLDVALNATNATFTKVYGQSDAVAKNDTYVWGNGELTLPIGIGGDEVSVKLSRENAGSNEGELVGDYAILVAGQVDPNYNVTIASGDNAPKFKIEKAGNILLKLTLYGTTVAHVYDAKAPRVELTQDNGNWVVKITGEDGKVWGQYVVTAVEESLDNGSNYQDVKVINAATFAGVTFNIENASKNVGEYNLTASFDNSKNKIYSNAEFAGLGKLNITKYNRVFTIDEAKNSITYTGIETVLTYQRTLTGVGDEQITVEFAREKGKNVGSYKVTGVTAAGDNAVEIANNYDLSLAKEDNLWFEITKVPGLTVSGEATPSTLEFVYAKANPTVRLNFNGSNWELVISVGGVTKTVSLSLKETIGDKEQNVSVDKDTLAGINFSIKEGASADVGTYTIIASGSANNYEGGFIFSRPFTFEITPADYKLPEGTLISKTYGDADPAKLSYVGTTTLGEKITIEFETRENAGLLAGESVGDHNLKSPRIIGNSNYKLTDTDWDNNTNKAFKIVARENLMLSATLSGNINHIYDGKVVEVLDVTVDAANLRFEVSVGAKTGENKEEWGKLYIGGTFKETAGDWSRDVKFHEGLLDGLTFVVAGASKNVGTYAVSANGNATYSNATFAFANTVKPIVISQKEITLTNKDIIFTKSYGQEDSLALASGNKVTSGNWNTAEIVTGVGQETLTIKWTRTNLGEEVGNYPIFIEGNETNFGNYKVTLATGENAPHLAIVRAENVQVRVTLAEGVINRVYNGLEPTANLVFENGGWIVKVADSKGNNWGSLQVSLIEESFDGSVFKPVAVINEKTLAGLSLEIQVPSKNVGTYDIIVVKEFIAENNATYSSAALNNGTGADRINITQKEIIFTQEEAGMRMPYTGRNDNVQYDKTLTGENNEQLVIKFTREEGKDVGEYKVTGFVVAGDNKLEVEQNYKLSLAEVENKWFVITRISGLKVEATATPNQLDFTYAKQAPTISAPTWDGENWKLTITVGAERQEIVLTLNETIDNDSQLVAADENTLKGFNFAIVDADANVGTYNISVSGSSNNFDNFEFKVAPTVNINAKQVHITYDGVMFTKEYGNTDPKLEKTFTNTENQDIIAGDSIKVTFTREEGETVRKYKLNLPENSWDNKNYLVKIDESNTWFEITTRQGTILQATVSGNIVNTTYNAKAPNTLLTKSYNQAEQTITLTMTDNNGQTHEFTISNFVVKETDKEDKPVTIENLEAEFAGIGFVIDGASANVGTYRIGTTVSQVVTYGAFALADNIDILKISPLNIQLTNENASFAKTYGEDDALAKLTVNNQTVFGNGEVELNIGVNNEGVKVKLSRDSAGSAIGEYVGSYSINGESMNTNYEITIAADDNAPKFTINKRAGITINATINGEPISGQYTNAKLNASIEYNSASRVWEIIIKDELKNTWGVYTLSDFTESADGYSKEIITDLVSQLNLNVFNLTFTTDAKDKGIYTLTGVTNGEHNNYYSLTLTNVTEKSVTITARDWEMTQQEAEKTVVYGSVGKDEVTFTKSLNGQNNEMVEVTFTRQAGVNVGKYAITNVATTNANYNVSINPDNDWFEITKIDDLNLHATLTAVDAVESATYKGARNIVVEAKFEEGNWYLYIMESDIQLGKYQLTAFKEVGTDRNAAPYVIDESLLKGFSFEVDRAVKDVGNYSINVVSDGTSINYAGFNFDGDSAQNIITVTPYTYELKENEASFNKVYGSADADNWPNGLKVELDLVEKVIVKLSRQEGERVGTYALSIMQDGIEVVDGNASNYSISIPENKWFEITPQAGLKLELTLSGNTIVRDYDGKAPLSVELKEGEFVLVVTDGNGETSEFNITKFNEVTAAGDKKELTSSEITLDLLKTINFSINGASKDVGTYEIMATANLNDYQGGVIFAGNTQLVTIEAKDIKLALPSDNTNLISKTFRDSDPELKFTFTSTNLANVIAGDEINVTFTRDTSNAIASENVGKYQLYLDSWDNKNYNVTLDANDWFEILPREGTTIELTLDINPLLTNVFTNQQISASLKQVGNDWFVELKIGEKEIGQYRVSKFVEKAPSFTNEITDEAAIRALGLDVFTISVANTTESRVNGDVDTYKLAVTGGSHINYVAGLNFTNGENVLQITPATLNIASETPLFTKTYGQNDSEAIFVANDAYKFPNAVVTGENGDQVAVTFTRENKSENVGKYTLGVTHSDYNYNSDIIYDPANEWFKITKIDDLVLKATISEKTTSEKLVYNTERLTITQPIIVDNTFEFTVRLGEQTKTFVLSGFKEMFDETGKEVTNLQADMLNGFTFAIENAKDFKDGGYNIVVTGLTNNYGSFEFENNANAVVMIDKATYKVESASPLFTFTYGTEIDTTLQKEFNALGEDKINVTFSVPENVQKVGYYTLSYNSHDNTNYIVEIDEANKWLHIASQSDLHIEATLDSANIIEMPYAGSQEFVINKTFEDGVWTISVGEHKFALKDFFEVDSKGVRKEITTAADTLTGIEFKLDRAVKDVGEYRLIASGNNDTYPIGFKFSGSDVVIKITKKDISLSNISKEFDQSKDFIKDNYTDDTANVGHKVTITGLVAGETVSLRGLFEDSEPGVNKAITNLSISGDHASNYNLVTEGVTGDITISSLKPTIEINEKSFTYGQVENGLDAIKATVKLDNEQDVSSFVNISFEIAENSFSTGGFLKAGTHTVKVNASSKYYTVESFEIEVNVEKLNITVSVEGEIVKVYDRNANVIQKYDLLGTLAKDDISVSGAYNDEMPAENKVVTFTLGGDDAENYNLTNATTTGTINVAKIAVTAEINTVAFVDGQNAVGTTSFILDYPIVTPNTAANEFAKLLAPTKTGYTFVGWRLDKNEDAQQLSVGNLESVLNGALDSKTLTIYATWKIETFTVTVNIDKVQGSYVISDNYNKPHKTGDVYTFNYYEKVTVTPSANDGYVLLSNEKVFEHITQNETVDFAFRAANIEFVMSVDRSTLYPSGSAEVKFEGEGWNAQGETATQREVAFTDEVLNSKINEFLPKVSVYGYSFISWKSEGVTITASTDSTVKEIIAQLNASFTDDITLTFNAEFKVNKHYITFDTAGGNEEFEKQEVTYGQVIGTLLTPTKTGYDFLNWAYVVSDDEEVVYSEDTIFEHDNDITLIARWGVGIYELKIENAHCSVQITDQNGEVVQKIGGVYKLSHEGTYTITATADAGYKIVNEWNITGGITIEYINQYTSAKATNINKNSTISISAEAEEHDINVIIDRANIVVTLDNNSTGTTPTENGFKFTAKTDQVVKIEVEADAGYEFSYVSTTGGNVAYTDGAYILTKFTGDVEMTFTSAPKSYNVTFSFGKGVDGFNIISGGQNPTINSVQVTTDTPLVIEPKFKEGYEFESVSATGGVSSNYDKESGYITFAGFTEEFSSSIVGTEKTFNLTSSVIPLNQDKIVQDSDKYLFEANVNATGKYLTTVNFIASKDESAKGYRFIGWFEGTLTPGEDNKLDYTKYEKVSDEETYAYTITGNKALTAIYEFSLFTAKASVEGKGEIYLEDIKVADSEDGTSYLQEYFFGQEFTLRAVAKSGYEFAGWMKDGQKYSSDATINVTIEGDIDLIAKFTPKVVKFDISAKVSVNGVDYDSLGFDYGSITWGSLNEEGEFVVDENASTLTNIPTVTDGSVYIKVTTNTNGYTFDSIYNMPEKSTGEINLISADKDKGEYIYEITSLNSEDEKGYGFYARFIANSTALTIGFKENGASIDAGRINVSDKGIGLSIKNNHSSVISLDAITSATFEVTASIRFGFSFADMENALNNISATSGVISNPSITAGSAKDGYSHQLTFTYSGFSGDAAQIDIKVVSTSYTVKLMDGENLLNTFENVKFGQMLNLTGFEMPEKTGYAFNGAYAFVNGYGKCYINKDMTSNVWNDNGYSYTPDGYIKNANFDADTNTFTIYVAWVINKSTITIDSVPPTLKEISTYKMTVESVITNLNSLNSWRDENNNYVVEVLYGANIGLKAPVYDGYMFDHWVITRTDANGAVTEETLSDSVIETLENRNYPVMKIVAHFNARVAISSNIGGKVSFSYQVNNEGPEIIVEDEAYLPADTSFTLHAVPDDGYHFIGWFNKLTGEKVGDALDLRIEHAAEDGKWLSAIEYEGRFEGNSVDVKVGEITSEHAKFVNVSLNGTIIPFTDGNISAKIGDTIIFTMEVNEAFEVIWTGGRVETRGNEYHYIVAFEDLAEDGKTITLTPEVNQKECDVIMVVRMNQPGNLNDRDLAGKVYYYEGEERIEAGFNLELTRLVGEEFKLEIVTNVNYKLASITFNGEDVTNKLVDGMLSLTLSVDMFTEGQPFRIIINYARDMWTDYADENWTLKGDGSDGKPYLINTAEDLAYVAYMVNNMDNAEFATKSFRLQANINLNGKFWSPIGTTSNPFNGSFDFSVYEVTNIKLVNDYKGEQARDGLFGYLGPNAKISEANRELMIALIIVGVLLLLIILALIIFFILRRRRKKKLEELANN